LFILGKYLIPGPKKWLLSLNSLDSNFEKLFTSNLSVQWQISFLLNGLFSAYNYIHKKNGESREKLDQLRFFLSKFLKSIIFFFYGIYSNWNNIKNSPYLMFIVGSSYLIINYLLEIIIGFMNDYGICNGFSLIFFIEVIQFRWIIGSLNALKNSLFRWKQLKKCEFIPFLSLLLISYLFIQFSKLKWEVPVETNKLYFSDNKSLNNDRSKFGIRINFGFMNIIQISLLVNVISALYLSIFGSRHINVNELLENYQEQQSEKSPHGVQSTAEEMRKMFVSSSFFKRLFLWLFNQKHVLQSTPSEFFLKDVILTNNRSGFFEVIKENRNKNSFFALLFLILFIYSINWVTIYYTQIKPSEISEDLKKRGIYFDGVSPGKMTKKIIGNSVNRLILLWTIFVIVISFLFDMSFIKHSDEQLYFSFMGCPGKYNLSFFNWFNGLNTGIELFKQIKTRYEYAKSYD
jgi:preprotein translocase subunit SecY